MVPRLIIHYFILFHACLHFIVECYFDYKFLVGSDSFTFCLPNTNSFLGPLFFSSKSDTRLFFVSKFLLSFSLLGGISKVSFQTSIIKDFA